MHLRLRRAVLFLFAIGHSFAALAFVHILENGKRWSVGNDTVLRTGSFFSADGLRMESLKHLVTGTDFTGQSADSIEFSFDASGRHFDGHSNWTLTEANTVALARGKALRPQLRNERDGLDELASSPEQQRTSMLLARSISISAIRYSGIPEAFASPRETGCGYTVLRSEGKYLNMKPSAESGFQRWTGEEFELPSLGQAAER